MTEQKSQSFAYFFCLVRVPDLFVLHSPRHSVSLGRFRRGRANQKIVQTKTGARIRNSKNLRIFEVANESLAYLNTSHKSINLPNQGNNS